MVWRFNRCQPSESIFFTGPFMLSGISTGSTLLNLALTDHPNVGWLKGSYNLFVGDSRSGKTFFCMTCCAEATLDPDFADYRLIYDNIEDGMHMDLERLFNAEVAERIEPPAGTKDEPEFSATVEDFYFNLDNAIYAAGWDGKTRKPSKAKNPRPFIYILDSADALDSEAAEKKFYQLKAQYTKRRGDTNGGEEDDDKPVKGSYGDGKAKKHSENIRKALKGLGRTGSILIVISQTRDDLTAMYAGAKTRAGGNALRFYAQYEVWSAIIKPLTKDVNGRKREIGNTIQLAIKKNRATGKLAKVTTDIYPSAGMDDLGACVDFLLEEGVWTKEKQTITCEGLNISGSYDKVVALIEKRGLEQEVRELCGKAWADLQTALAVKRKNKYAKADTADTED